MRLIAKILLFQMPLTFNCLEHMEVAGRLKLWLKMQLIYNSKAFLPYLGWIVENFPLKIIFNSPNFSFQRN
jgi:hypothetical protein